MKYLFCLFFFIAFKSHSQDVFDAARLGDTNALKICLNLNPDTLSAVDSHGFTPLILSTYRSQTKCVEWIISKGVDVNYHSPEGIALLGACFKGNAEIAKILIDAGSDVNAIGARGGTSLIYAVWSDNVTLVKLLLNHGADRLMMDDTGSTAKDYALRMNSIEMVSLFE